MHRQLRFSAISMGCEQGHGFQGQGLSAQPKARPRPRPQLDRANNFSVKHKKSYAKVIQIRENIIYILTPVNVYDELLSFCNFSLHFVTFQKHQHWPRPRLTRPRP